MTTSVSRQDNPEVAFVLGGGGYLGGYQVGMVRALFERGITPDLIVGTSAGAIQGALIARDPTMSTVDTLTAFWSDCVKEGVMKVRPGRLLANAVQLRPALASQNKLRDLLIRYLGKTTRIEDLEVPYQACAASIERSTSRYFDSGPLIPAVLASCAIPGLWPPVAIGGEHFVDGGVVETIPVSRAVAYGPKKIYVMRLRQREQPLQAPRWPWQLGGTIFEVSRRHKLGQVVHMRPDGVEVHLLPTGEELLEPPDNGLTTSVSEHLQTIHRRIEQGYLSACEYLDDIDGRHTATVRAKARHQLGASTRSYKDTPVSSFVTEKLHRHFELFDSNNDDLVNESDFLAMADRISAAFDNAPDSRAAATLRATYATYWQAMCQAVEVNGQNGIGRSTFDRALVRLTSDPVAYDVHMHPVVVSILAAADSNGDHILSRAEIQKLTTAFGVQPADARTFALRLDTNGDGVIGIDELDEAYRDYFTSDEPSSAGNLMFGIRKR